MKIFKRFAFCSLLVFSTLFTKGQSGDILGAFPQAEVIQNTDTTNLVTVKATVVANQNTELEAPTVFWECTEDSRSNMNLLRRYPQSNKMIYEFEVTEELFRGVNNYKAVIKFCCLKEKLYDNLTIHPEAELSVFIIINEKCKFPLNATAAAFQPLCIINSIDATIPVFDKWDTDMMCPADSISLGLIPTYFHPGAMTKFEDSSNNGLPELELSSNGNLTLSYAKKEFDRLFIPYLVSMYDKGEYMIVASYISTILFEKNKNIDVFPSNSILASNDLKVYPNPTTGLLTVEGSIKDHNITVNMYDNKGRHVRSWQSLKSGAVLDLRKEFPSGMYLVHLKTEGTEKIEKVVIE